MVGEGAAAAAARDGADLFENQLAQLAFVGPDFQLRRAVIDDFERDLSPETGVNRRGGEVDGHAEAGLLASALDASGQFAADRKIDVFESPDKDQAARRDDNHAAIVRF